MRGAKELSVTTKRAYTIALNKEKMLGKGIPGTDGRAARFTISDAFEFMRNLKPGEKVTVGRVGDTRACIATRAYSREICGVEFSPQRPNQVYCCAGCQNRASTFISRHPNRGAVFDPSLLTVPELKKLIELVDQMEELHKKGLPAIDHHRPA